MFRWLFIKLVRFYQLALSPLFPPSCRYSPTCSTYTIHAIEKHGAFKGLIMGLARISRCHPFVAGGKDPVPDYFTLRRSTLADGSPKPHPNYPEPITVNRFGIFFNSRSVVLVK